MANTVEQWQVEQFKGNVIHLAQQKESRLRGAVTEQDVTGDKYHFERLGTAAAVKKTTRHSNTPVLDLPHSRRTGDMEDYEWADLCDPQDVIRMLASPKSSYAQSGSRSMMRAFDDLIIKAATGDSVDGDGTVIALPAAQKIAHASAGMTLEKLIETKERMDAAEIDEDDERFMVIGSRQVSNLLNSNKVTSEDYASVKALVQGDIDTFMGFKFIRSERLAINSSIRSCFAFTKAGIGLGVGADIKTKVDERADKSYAWQIYLSFTAGATRIQDECVVQVDCSEA